MTHNLSNLVQSLANCPCGRKHEVNIDRIEIGAGVLDQVGRVLLECGHSKGSRIHVVADRNTLAASEGILDILRASEFILTTTIYDDLQTADIEGVKRVIAESADAPMVLSVGTGSLNDICRYACFKTGTAFCIFATAPSMDGFASTMAPITENGFKRTYPAIGPKVLLADTRILAHSPVELKAAGLGDLLGKYTALADWEVATLTTGEYYCERIATVTREAVNKAVRLARSGRADQPDEAYAAALMEALILSGVAMFLSQSTRPASGSEHHIAHFLEMQYARRGLKQMFHGKKVGIACGMVADVYNRLSRLEAIRTKPHIMETGILQPMFGELYPELLKENTPDPVQAIDPQFLRDNWGKIREILSRVPSGEDVRSILRSAGGVADWRSAGITEDLARFAIRYGYYARFRITLMRILGMVDLAGIEDEIYAC
jgi:glycerol-1-phosphate dehydrogenase [NAD(P)+]